MGYSLLSIALSCSLFWYILGSEEAKHHWGPDDHTVHGNIRTAWNWKNWKRI